MYGLLQAGLLANELLENQLNTHGYYQSKLVPGLWTHEWHSIQFTLVVNNFGVKHVGDEHLQHLLQALREHFLVTTDQTGSHCIGIMLDWDMPRDRCICSCPDTLTKLCNTFSMQNHRSHNICLFSVCPSNMASGNNMPKYLICHHLWTSKVRNPSKKSVENSFSLDEWSTLHSSPPSAPLLHNLLNPLWRCQSVFLLVHS
ncbi:hypothetical protein ACHAW6_001287 [Cyclotella cf. meneghiniana]